MPKYTPLPRQAVMKNSAPGRKAAYEARVAEWEAKWDRYHAELPNASRNRWVKRNPKPRHYRNKNKWIQEVRFYQKSGELIFAKAVMARLIREINGGKHRFQRSALDAIQLAAETALTTLFECGVKMMVHGKRSTLRVEDMRLVREVADAIGSEYFGQTAPKV